MSMSSRAAALPRRRAQEGPVDRGPARGRLRRVLRRAPAFAALLGAACFQDNPPDLEPPSSTGEPSSTTGSSATTTTSTSTTTDPTTGIDPSAPTTLEVHSTGTTGDVCLEGQEPRPWYVDADMDGFGAGEPVVVACQGPEGAADKPGDCDDGAVAVNPDAVEQCNALVDDDCDGLKDELSDANVACAGCRLGQHQDALLWACPEPLLNVAAEARCQQYGAAVHLASVRTVDEDLAVRNLIASLYMEQPATYEFWIGLRRRPEVWSSCAVVDDETAWEWIDGTPGGLFVWGQNQPDNFGCDPDCIPMALDDPTCPRQNCAVFNDYAGNWNDRSCNEMMKGFVCKTAP